MGHYMKKPGPRPGTPSPKKKALPNLLKEFEYLTTQELALKYNCSMSTITRTIREQRQKAGVWYNVRTQEKTESK